jgi:hypothetical protein
MALVAHKLLAAINAKFAATVALTTAFGATPRYYREMVPSGTATYPYVVSEMPAASLIDAYGNRISSEISIVFKVVGTPDEQTVAGHMDTLLTAFDNTTLSLTGATNIGMYRESEPVSMRLGQDGITEVWQWAASYKYSVQ